MRRFSPLCYTGRIGERIASTRPVRGSEPEQQTRIMVMHGTLGLLGCGNMGGAIVLGLIESGTISPEHTLVFDIDPDRAKSLKLPVAQSPVALAQHSNTLILATKPQDIDEALAALKPGLTDDTLVVSIAAGISIATIQKRIGAQARVARAMPNTPALVGACAAGIALSEACTASDKDTVHTIFAAIGVAVDVSEDELDAVTALSGSGPAYFFYMVECLVEAATELGLSGEQAAQLAGQTLYGAGKLLMESGESAATLRERVTSKGGTTFAALEAFDAQDLRAAIRAGVHAAAARSRELGT